MDTQRMEAVIEAILFAKGTAVEESEIARVLEMEPDEAKEVIEHFAEKWNSELHGTSVIRLEDSYQMCTRKEFYPELISLELHPRKPRLTDVQMETLSVIAYKQPVTKAEIERIRGVNSDHAVNKLIEYHLVAELGRAKQPGRPILFGTTEDFLRAFGVASRTSLPEISVEMAENFKNEAEQEVCI